MEVMSPLFLYALMALLPQALGKSPGKFLSMGGLATNKFMNRKQINDTNESNRIKFIVPSTNNRVSDLQSVFMNSVCKECHSCMEQAIKAHKVHSHMNIEAKTNDVPNEIDDREQNTTNRNKRNLETNSELKIGKKSTKKLKTKKNKNNKSIAVTKYSDGGKIYALKVKDATSLISGQQNETKAPVAKCQIYRVRESFPCDSPDVDFIFTEKRKMINGENNLPIEKKKENRVIPPVFKKHHVIEESQISENFMPSIEEMY